MDKRRFRKLKSKYGLNDAGKGDAPRPQDREMYQLGQNILHAESEEEKHYWVKEWEKAKARRGTGKGRGS